MCPEGTPTAEGKPYQKEKKKRFFNKKLLFLTKKY